MFLNFLNISRILLIKDLFPKMGRKKDKKK